MKRTTAAVLTGMCVLILSLSLNCLAEDLEKKQRELRTQIILYNLVNGLYLTNDQMEYILGNAKELDSLRERLEQKKKSNAPTLTQALLDLKEEVKHEVPQVSENLAKRIHQGNNLLLRLRKEYIDALGEATEQVKSTLSDNQIYLIKSFKPCLIPPKGPARIGQLSSQGGPTRLLERIRNMPARRYETRKYEIADRIIEKLSVRSPRLSTEQLGEAKIMLLRAMDDVRKLSDVEFALQKEDMAHEIKNTVLRDKHKENEIDVDKRIARFLLSPQIIPVLEEGLSEREGKQRDL
jgi:hypothetical protein